MINLVALISGLLFGVGLTVSQMINPNKIQDFLDITGQWDASLLFVMLGALIVTWMGYHFVLRLPTPKFHSSFQLPTKTNVDKRLILGAAIFGIGWGLAGYCPGPAISAMGLGIMDAIYVVLGMVLAALFFKRSIILYFFKNKSE